MAMVAAIVVTGSGSVLELGTALVIFFFFQAEDGIRDLTVTGVQTCALPIYPDVKQALARVAALLRDEAEAIETLGAAQIAGVLSGSPQAVQVAVSPFAQIGRGSCRGRG